MPYQPIQLDENIVDKELLSFIRNTIDPAFEEFHFLLTMHMPNQGSNGSLQKSLAILLLSMLDGAAQLLQPDPDNMKNGERFISFIIANYPWDEDSPEGISKEDACQVLWDDMRCSMLHRFGLRSKNPSQSKISYGRSFSTNDEKLTCIETCITERPYSAPSIKKTDERITLSIESFYWGLRLAIKNALSTKKKSDAVLEWIKNRQWDPKKKSANTNPPN